MLLSPNLSLDYIDVNSAQREVVHNAAIRALDALVQLAVLDRDLATPPGSPSDGQRWIVAASPTGAWAGHAKHVAAWQDGAWHFYVPQVGWFAYVVDEGWLAAWNGSAWVDAMAMLTSLQNLLLLGVGTTADSTNPLSAKLNNTLWMAKTVAEGGDGNLRYKLSKESSSKTLSFLFQDNYSGRAEIGLTGDDDFHFKVSPDGSTWVEALKIAAATGKVSFPVSGGPREMLSANRTYYVRTDGSDSNNGLANTSGGAFLTIQKAIDTIANGIDLAGYNVTIQVAAGTYTGAVAVSAPWVGTGNVSLLGDTTTPSNVVLSPASGAAVTVGVSSSSSAGSNAARLLLGGFKITTTNANAIAAFEGSLVSVIGKMDFGATGTAAQISASRGSAVYLNSGYTISGSAALHWSAANHGRVICNSQTVTLSGSPVFSAGFAKANRQAQIICIGNTFSGATGSSSLRYALLTLGLLDTNAAGATYLPGDTSGTNDGTGVYN
jgi:Protein of unknown function (DUF2793)